MNVREKPAVPPPAGKAARARKDESERGASRARVLLVDDDERNLIAMRSTLEDIAEVVTASSGEGALRELLRGDFAVILLDVIMPGMDGYETATMIRGREQTKRIPIVFLSAVNKDTTHLLRGYSMGAVDYVFKPVEPLVLRSKVAVFVDLFEMNREIELKAKYEQKLLDDNLRANAERLIAERGLRAAEQRQAAIIKSLPILLYLEPLKASPRWPVFVSGDFETMTGYSYDHGKKHPKLWEEGLHAEDRKRVLAALAAREGTGSFAVEYRWRCRDGRYKHFLDQAVLLRSPSGEPKEFAGTLLDVTDRKTLEGELLHARKMDAIGKLTGGIAHDFNNLLAAVLGGIGLIERRVPLEEEHRKITQMTRRAAEQGAELVKRLLAFSRRQQLEPAPIDLMRLSSTVSELLAHTLGGLIKLEWALTGDAWLAYADAAQLELAMMNLIINARDAMPEGGTVTVSAANRRLTAGNEHGLDPGDYVVLTVADEGCGMSDDVLDRVMEPFFTTKEIGKGTGLGLSMVYGFARQSGGTIDIESRVGEGTGVHIWLPRSSAAALGRAAPAEQPPLRAEPGRSLRILLVDDHEGVRHATAGMLEDLGHSVDDVASGAEMLSRLRGDPAGYNLIVTDYAMPLKSGGEAMEEARALRADIAGLIITGHADEEAITRRPDRTVLLTKPFTPARLSHALAESLGQVGWVASTPAAAAE